MTSCPRKPPSGIFNLIEDGWSADNTCSYCGSLYPDTFLRLVESGCVVVPTDKNYEAYIRMDVGGQHKFYFDHLSTEQKVEFVELLNQKKVKFDYPGYFYRTPFFIRVESPAV